MKPTFLLAFFVAIAAACSGSAPASQPSAADTITTAAPPVRPSDTGGLSETEFKAMHELRTDAAPTRRGVTIDLAGGRAYLSLPAGKTGPMPGIVVIHEWWGLNDHIAHWADRLAGAGYAALAVDLYGGKAATNPDDAMQYMKTVDDARAAATISAALDFLAKDPRIQAPKRGVIGWCFGGGWSLRTAIAHPDLSAAVVYYGQLESDPARIGAIRAHLLGIFGNRDDGIPPAKVDEFEAALKKAGVSATIYRYDAQHAFANPSGAKYDETAAADAWNRVTAFLADTLGR